MRGTKRSREPREEGGFTIVELVIAMAMLAMVIAPLAGVFWSAIRTAGVATHRTDGSSIASREIEGMRAVPYAQVGFYADQPGYDARTVSLGSTSPASGPLVPQIQPGRRTRARPQRARSDPTNASAIVQGGVSYSVHALRRVDRRAGCEHDLYAGATSA